MDSDNGDPGKFSAASDGYTINMSFASWRKVGDQEPNTLLPPLPVSGDAAPSDTRMLDDGSCQVGNPVLALLR